MKRFTTYCNHFKIGYSTNLFQYLKRRILYYNLTVLCICRESYLSDKKQAGAPHFPMLLLALPTKVSKYVTTILFILASATTLLGGKPMFLSSEIISHALRSKYWLKSWHNGVKKVFELHLIFHTLTKDITRYCLISCSIKYWKYAVKS